MLIANKTINKTGDTYTIHLDTLGIINGCVDLLTQELGYPEMAYNNTYGIKAINETLYQQAVDNFNRPDTGCRDLIIGCRSLADEGDPLATGNNDTVNQACIAASVYCSNNVESQYINASGRNYYDIAAFDPDPFPPSYYLGYLSQHWVQAALGVPINYTQSTNGVYYAFQNTGDYARTDIRGGQLNDIAYLLDNGIKVALIYGDRDYACNCKFCQSLVPFQQLTLPLRDRWRSSLPRSKLHPNPRLSFCRLRRYSRKRKLHRRPSSPTRQFLLFPCLRSRP